MFDILLIVTLLSIAAIVAGNVVLFVLVFALTRASKKKRKASQAAVAPVMAAMAEPQFVEELVGESELDDEPELELIEEEEPPESIIIANDYEEEANPVHTSPELLDDSFVSLFEDIPVVTVDSLPWRQKHERNSRMANRLDRLTAPPSEPARPSSDQRVTKPTSPLPMPVAPAGVEPIPELEPTELIIDRPEWAAEWP